MAEENSAESLLLNLSNILVSLKTCKDLSTVSKLDIHKDRKVLKRLKGTVFKIHSKVDKLKNNFCKVFENLQPEQELNVTLNGDITDESASETSDKILNSTPNKSYDGEIFKGFLTCEQNSSLLQNVECNLEEMQDENFSHVNTEASAIKGAQDCTSQNNMTSDSTSTVIDATINENFEKGESNNPNSDRQETNDKNNENRDFQVNYDSALDTDGKIIQEVLDTEKRGPKKGKTGEKDQTEKCSAENETKDNVKEGKRFDKVTKRTSADDSSDSDIDQEKNNLNSAEGKKQDTRSAKNKVKKSDGSLEDQCDEEKKKEETNIKIKENTERTTRSSKRSSPNNISDGKLYTEEEEINLKSEKHKGKTPSRKAKICDDRLEKECDKKSEEKMETERKSESKTKGKTKKRLKSDKITEKDPSNSNSDSDSDKNQKDNDEKSEVEKETERKSDKLTDKGPSNNNSDSDSGKDQEEEKECLTKGKAKKSDDANEESDSMSESMSEKEADSESKQRESIISVHDDTSSEDTIQNSSVVDNSKNETETKMEPSSPLKPMLKLVDISKLMPPGVKPLDVISPSSRPRKSVTFDSSVIILTSSDDEENPPKVREEPLKSDDDCTRLNSDSDPENPKRRSDRNKEKRLKQTRRMRTIEVSDDSLDDSDFEINKKSRSEKNKARTKSKFAMLKDERARKSKVVERKGDEKRKNKEAKIQSKKHKYSSDSSDDESEAECNWENANANDPKFAMKVLIKLPKFLTEDLQGLYEKKKEVFQVQRNKMKPSKISSKASKDDTDRPKVKKLKISLKRNDNKVLHSSDSEHSSTEDVDNRDKKRRPQKDTRSHSKLKEDKQARKVNESESDSSEENKKKTGSANENEQSSKKNTKNNVAKRKLRNGTENVSSDDTENEDNEKVSEQKALKKQNKSKKGKNKGTSSDEEKSEDENNIQKDKGKITSDEEKSGDENSIQKSTEKKLVNSDTVDGSNSIDEKADNSDNNDKSSETNKKRKKGDESTDKDSESDTEKHCNGKKKKKTDKDEDEVTVLSSAESDDDIIATKKKKDVSRKVKKKKLLISDSDDSDAEKKKNNAENDSSDKDSDKSSEEKSGSSGSDAEEDKAGKNKSRSRIKREDNSSSDDDEKSTRKSIRKLIDKDSLSDTTKKAEADEKERKARIAEKQRKYNQLFELKSDVVSDKIILDFDEKKEKELLTVNKKLVKNLKPHQVDGVKFMWDACFESVERVKKTKGSGCILAHCMGLGKTLQVVTLSHTLLTNSKKTQVEKIMVVTPVNTVLNWKSEFHKWLPKDTEFEVYDLVSCRTSSINYERSSIVKDWHENGGVLIVGYNMFRTLSNPDNKAIPKKLRNIFQEGLVDPGPDLVVCDEGHLLKNEKTNLSIAMNRIKTLRRIVLTGTPLQNNLKEYWCMVQFIKPNLLGTYKEYLNRFVNPITNGQYTDSTLHDTQLMRKRSHVLHKLLDGVVQRQDYCVLAPYLPPKHEYVLFINLTEVQKKLYRHYMDNLARRASDGSNRTSFLFVDYQELQRICTHPRVLLDKSKEDKVKIVDEDEESEGSLKDFIDDGSESETDESDEDSSDDSASDSSGSYKKKKKKKKGKKEKKAAPSRLTRAQRAQKRELGVESDSDVEVPTSKEWWQQFIDGNELENINNSGKMELLFQILKDCEEIGDKILVFSQSLYTLNCIEYFLQTVDEASQSGDSNKVGGYTGSWALGLDYFRLDGSSSCDNRAAWCDSFNNPSNTRARLFLISTRAGGLGINLVAANRVIIFDVSWNPSHDIQSIYRVYRFGQTKPSYIYRFVTYGTMEMKIYERQVTKQAISKRVIDEQQIDRHYSQNDIQELYKMDLDEQERPIPLVPKDVLLGEMLQKYSKTIFKYHEHQSLLENKEAEGLNEEERKAAWEEFENEKVLRQNTSSAYNMLSTGLANNPMAGQLNASPALIQAALFNIVKKDNPTWADTQIRGILPALVQQLQVQMSENDFSMYGRVQQEIRLIQVAYQQQEAERLQRAMYQRQLALMQQQAMQNKLLGNLSVNPALLERMFQQPLLSNFLPTTSKQQSTGSSSQRKRGRPSTISSEVIDLND